VQPLASIKALNDPIYEAFYGLREQPFAITTDPRFFYLSASHRRAFSELLNGLRRRESLLLLTGDTGTGKTTLCRAVLDALGERTFAAMVLNPYMAGSEVLRIVLRDFGLVSHEDLRRGALAKADVAQLLDTLEGFLRSLIPLGSHAVIVLDEAQSLDPQILDQIRLLTALEYNGHRLVQVVLCGQPGLLDTLKADAMSALNERITRRVELAPLPADQVEGYIQHRLSVAGGASAVSFEPAAAHVVADLARGLPRRINVLCDRALQEGRLEGVSAITPELVKRAARAVAGAHDVAPGPAETSRLKTTEPSPAPELPALTFGQQAEGDAATPARPWRRLAIFGAAGAVLLGSLGYYLYARSALTGGPDVPAAPAGPDLTAGSMAGPVPIPSDAEIEAALVAPFPVRPRAAVPAEPTDGTTAEGSAPLPASGQLPQNRDQLD
jgi:general secretion pathway protein A